MKCQRLCVIAALHCRVRPGGRGAIIMLSRTHLGIMLRVLGNVIVVDTKHWPDQVRDTTELKGLDNEVKLDPKAHKMAACSR